MSMHARIQICLYDKENVKVELRPHPDAGALMFSIDGADGGFCLSGPPDRVCGVGAAIAALFSPTPDALISALEAIERIPPAPFSLDRLQHANNTIEEMRQPAREALGLHAKAASTASAPKEPPEPTPDPEAQR